MTSRANRLHRSVTPLTTRCDVFSPTNKRGGIFGLHTLLHLTSCPFLCSCFSHVCYMAMHIMADGKVLFKSRPPFIKEVMRHRTLTFSLIGCASVTCIPKIIYAQLSTLLCHIEQCK